MKEVVIVSAVRTPIGAFGGALSEISPVTLGSIVIEKALERAGIAPEGVDDVYMGCILQAGHGQNVARQAAIKAGIPASVPATTINMLCGSGLRAVSLAAQTIVSGENDLVVVGGTENMSQAAYLLENARFGLRMGAGKMTDTMIHDALTDAFEGYHMGITAENLAKRHDITRAEQDAFALKSQLKALAAIDSGRFKDEIVPVQIPQKRGENIIFDTDEYPKRGIALEKLSALRPAFMKEGTVTAGNASGINDGAAALVVMSKEKADAMGLKPLAKILAHASAGVEPAYMGYGPVPATEIALKRCGLSIEDIDLIEANEAFAAQALAVGKGLGWDPEKVNPNGGAIALGHPVGASGARILVTLLHEMQKKPVRYGLATLCIGGGMGTSVVVERL